MIFEIILAIYFIISLLFSIVVFKRFSNNPEKKRKKFRLIKGKKYGK